MGKNKIKIEKLLSERSRQITWYKRKKGWIKKAMELSIWCDANIFLHIASKDHPEDVTFYSSIDFHRMRGVLRENLEKKEREVYLNEDYNNWFSYKDDTNSLRISKKSSSTNVITNSETEADPITKPNQSIWKTKQKEPKKERNHLFTCSKKPFANSHIFTTSKRNNSNNRPNSRSSNPPPNINESSNNSNISNVSLLSNFISTVVNNDIQPEQNSCEGSSVIFYSNNMKTINNYNNNTNTMNNNWRLKDKVCMTGDLNSLFSTNNESWEVPFLNRGYPNEHYNNYIDRDCNSINFENSITFSNFENVFGEEKE